MKSIQNRVTLKDCVYAEATLGLDAFGVLREMWVIAISEAKRVECLFNGVRIVIDGRTE